MLVNSCWGSDSFVPSSLCQRNVCPERYRPFSQNSYVLSIIDIRTSVNSPRGLTPRSVNPSSPSHSPFVLTFFPKKLDELEFFFFIHLPPLKKKRIEIKINWTKVDFSFDWFLWMRSRIALRRSVCLSAQLSVTLSVCPLGCPLGPPSLRPICCPSLRLSVRSAVRSSVRLVLFFGDNR